MTKEHFTLKTTRSVDTTSMVNSKVKIEGRLSRDGLSFPNWWSEMENCENLAGRDVNSTLTMDLRGKLQIPSAAR